MARVCSVVAVLFLITLFTLFSTSTTVGTSTAVGNERSVVVFAFVIIGAVVCYSNHAIGIRISKHLDNRFIRGLSQLLISLAVSTIGGLLGFFILVLKTSTF